MVSNIRHQHRLHITCIIVLSKTHKDICVINGESGRSMLLENCVEFCHSPMRIASHVMALGIIPRQFSFHYITLLLLRNIIALVILKTVPRVLKILKMLIIFPLILWNFQKFIRTIQNAQCGSSHISNSKNLLFQFTVIGRVI